MVEEEGPAQVVICGGGIVGLVLALALHEHVGVKAELYEKVSAFHQDVGAGMGMYPNGLRVIRDISPSLFDSIRDSGHPFLLRRFERHDGREVAVGDEDALCPEDEELKSIGIRRWRLQRVLYDAVTDIGIKVNFGKYLTQVTTRDDKLVEIAFEDGTTRLTEILFGADGTMSKVREFVAGESPHLEYTGVTCIMGMANLGRESRGICFPSAATTKCHACYFPTKEEEQCFQINFPIPAEKADQGSWGTLSNKVGKEECRKLAERLRDDGWDEKYLSPLNEVTHAVRVGYCTLKPMLEKWVYGDQIVLLGDAAHPPVPYTGQGAQMGLEDAGVIALLMKKLCLDDNGKFQKSKFGDAMKIYEKMRIPRAKEIQEISSNWGNMEQKRSDNPKYNVVKEEKIRRDVFFHLTLPIMFPGVNYDYKVDVEKVLQKERVVLPKLSQKKE
jgi:salicylate hydroxylase